MSSERDKMMGVTTYLDFLTMDKPYRKVEPWDRRNARTELAALRAEVTALRQAVNEARELRTLAEELVNALGYWLSLDQEPQECVKAESALGEWLAAHPAAPDVTPQPVSAFEAIAKWMDTQEDLKP